MISTYNLSEIPTDSRGRTHRVREVDSGLMSFPAGEAHAKPTDGAEANMIVIRWDGADDFLSAAMLVELNRSRGIETDLFVPYLPGARADRGVPLGAQHYANLINMVGARRVYAMDPHSKVLPGMIEGFRAFHPEDYIPDALASSGMTPYAGVIVPDAGARGRASAVSAALGVPFFQAIKRRDPSTGQLSGFAMTDSLPDEGKLLVVDDICDGGGTFRGLASSTSLPRERIDLWVTHGVFSGRAKELGESFGAIHYADTLPFRSAPRRAIAHSIVVPLLSRLHLAR